MATEAKGEVKVAQFLTPRRASLNRRHSVESTSLVIAPLAEEEFHILRSLPRTREAPLRPYRERAISSPAAAGSLSVCLSWPRTQTAL